MGTVEARARPKVKYCVGPPSRLYNIIIILYTPKDSLLEVGSGHELKPGTGQQRRGQIEWRRCGLSDESNATKN